MHTYKEESPFCKVWDFKGVIKNGLNVHMRRKHDNIEQISCYRMEKISPTYKFCGIIFQSDKGLEFHIRWEQGNNLRQNVIV